MTCPLIRIDTNQGLVGYGEVRDGASETYALSLKSRVLGENPCNVDKIFRKIKQFGGHARQAGGVCGDRDGADGPGRQGLGRAVLADARRQVPRSRAALRRHHRGAERQGAGPEAQGADGSRHHLSEAGLRHQPAAERARHAEHAGRLHDIGQSQASMHPFTGIEITDKGIAWLDDWVGDAARGDRPGDPALDRSLRPHRRQQLHQAGAGDGEAQPRVDGGHGAVAVRRADEADQGQHDHADPDRRGHLS